MKYVLFLLFLSVLNPVSAQYTVYDSYYYEDVPEPTLNYNDDNTTAGMTSSTGTINPAREISNNDLAVFSKITNVDSPLPPPPALAIFPDLNTISDILTPENTLEDIKSEFDQSQLEYTGAKAFTPSAEMQGLWWRFYTQDTSLFGIPGVSEELLVIEPNGKAIWIQNVKTSQTVQAKSQRLLNISQYDLFGYSFFVFHYADQDPMSQKVRDRQGYFVRFISDQGYFQMSKSPNFEPDNSIYWKRFPTIKSD